MIWEVNGPVPRLYRALMPEGEFTGVVIEHVFKNYANRKSQLGERLQHGWEDEVWQALALSHRGHIRAARSKARPMVSLRSAVGFLRFISKAVEGEGLVGTPEARKRALTCFSCPLQSGVAGCTICKQALKLAVEPPEKVPAPEGCLACGCWLPGKIWVQKQHLGSAEDFPYWSECWMRD